MLELAKGKFTTDPTRHTGEGVFFTSRIFDAFEIRSGNLTFEHRSTAENDALVEPDSRSASPGTTVIMSIAVDSARTLKDVFDQFSSGPDDYAFAKTVVPVRLARIGNEGLMSRSQAKRLLRRVDRFQHVTFDFAGIATVGQAFADEVFRVFANAHPNVELGAIHAQPAVQQMIRRAETARDEEAKRSRRR